MKKLAILLFFLLITGIANSQDKKYSRGAIKEPVQDPVLNIQMLISKATTAGASDSALSLHFLDQAMSKARELNNTYWIVIINIKLCLQSNFASRSNKEIPSLNLEKINRHLPDAISEREFSVLQYIYNGKSNRQISESLFVSYNTIKKHINNAYLKLDVNSRTSAIVRLRELMMK